VNHEPPEGTPEFYSYNTTKLIDSMTPQRLDRLEDLMRSVEAARNATGEK
jgi:hypothetical protein